MTQPAHVTIHDIHAARHRIAPYIHRTPVIEIEKNVFIKAEHKQVVKSFKPRGACNAMLRLSDEEKKKGVIARSSGNFAQGLSYIGHTLGVSVTIVMPEHAPKIKVESTRSFGARVILKGHHHSESQAVVDQLSQSENLIKLHPFDHNDVIAGQGTAMLEICEDVPHIDIFFCPISGGGLLAGCATVLKAIHPNAIIIGVEPEGAADYGHYRKTGQLVKLETTTSVADGLLAPCVGERCKPLLDAYVDAVIVLSDDAILDAMRWLNETKGEEVEASGAASVAGYREYKKTNNVEGIIVVCMTSGGNFASGINA